MYPRNTRQTGASNIPRYASAPGSVLTAIVDSVIGNSAEEEFPESLMSSSSRYFTGDSDSTTSSKVNVADRGGGLQRSYGFNQIGVTGGGSSSPLIRHSSSPAGFFNHLMVDNGFSVTRGIGSYNSQSGTPSNGIPIGRLKSQLSFTRQDSLSQISEVSENVADGSSSDDGARNGGPSYVSGSFPMGPWEDTNTIMFSSPPNKRGKSINEDYVAALSGVESHSQFGLRRTSLDMATVENLLQMQPDSVPCKIRAKRGFATHPRSIAERERRTRISEKLRKLQELVPNMDKQTSTADMLELAVQHIKGLQTEVQKLNKDLEHCTCGCKQAI